MFYNLGASQVFEDAGETPVSISPKQGIHVHLQLMHISLNNEQSNKLNTMHACAHF